MLFLMYWTICLISASVNVSCWDGIEGDNPTDAPPNLIILKSSSSVLADRYFASVRSRVLTPSPRASARGPSPFPLSPWQGEQVPMKLSMPRSEEHTSELQSQFHL